MADYYPLLAKAVAGLPNSTPEARRAIYERARKALYGQLRSLDPPVPEVVVEREARALEEAVARLEVEISLEAPGDVEAEPDPPAPVPAPDEPTAPAPDEPPVTIAENDAGPGAAAPETDTIRPSEEAPSAVAGDAPVAQLAPAAQVRKETRRPSVPVPVRQAAVPKRLWIVGAAVGVVVVLVAILAYALRDRPEDVARPLSPSPSSLDDTAAAGGKIVDRIGSGETRPVEPPPPPAVKREEPAKAHVLPVEPAAAVARRAALLIEAPDEQAKVKTYLGTVVWRIDNVSNGPGEPLGTAVRAEIDIPEEKLQAVMTFQKNVDSALPASHTMKLRFVLQPGGPLGSVKHINVPHMRREDTATGDPLNGVPVPVMENSFLVGLAKGTAEATNLDLLRSREWLDVPMLFANGRIAKLTFEKGTSGQRALEDAIASWQAQ